MTMKISFLALTVFCAALMAGCASPSDPSRYAHEQPALDLRDYFNGNVDDWGIVQNRRGAVIRRFTVAINCQWSGDVGTLDESFMYSDGTRQRRVWTIRRIAEGQYTGSADDVIREVTGNAAGNALHSTYAMAVPLDGHIYHVDFNDWMSLVDENVLLNRATMTKFGITVGEVILSSNERSE
jgi:hypothetical protein